MRIYMDVCCLNRPFDDWSQDRVYIEAESILSIIERCKTGEWTLVSSGMIDLELAQLRDNDRLGKVQELYSVAQEFLIATQDVEETACFFQQHGVKKFDSIHLALAKCHGVDIFLTTDDKLLRAARTLHSGIAVENPAIWLMGVWQDEQYRN